MRQVLRIGLLALLLTGPAYTAEISPDASAALVDLNSSFLEAHATARELNLAQGGPIILYRDGELVLIRDQKESIAPVILPDFETFKTFAHLPVAIYLMLGPPGPGPLDDDRLKQLDRYLAKLKRVEEQIENIGLTGDNRERQKQILLTSKRFLNNVSQRKECSTEELLAFTRSMTPHIRANLAGAAASQLDAIHRQVMAWKKELSPEELSRLRVAVSGAVLAREGNLTKQYFERLLDLPGEGVRLVYMERYYPPTPMLTLLATRSVDQGISIAIFDDPDRMFRDVLQEAAAAHIKTMDFGD